MFEQTKHDGLMHGFTANYIKVETPYQTELINETKAVLLGDFNEEGTALTVKIIGERC